MSIPSFWGQPLRHSLAAILLALLLILLAPAGQAHAAIIAVNTTADSVAVDGACSLREAIIAANTNAAVDSCVAGAGADSITLPAGTYTLALAGAGEDAAATGDLDITESLTITGAGTPQINAAGLDRVLHVTDPAVNLTINGVVMTGGAGVDEGAGIYNNGGVITLNNNSSIGAAPTGNVANLSGGGIYNLAGTVVLDNSVAEVNTANGTLATQGGGGIYSIAGPAQTAWVILRNGSTVRSSQASSGAARGGGIYSSAATGGTAIVEMQTASNLQANVASSGGALYLGNSYLNATGGAAIFNNTAATHGGGILAEASTIEFTGSFLGNASANTATAGSGGGLHITGGSASFSGTGAIASGVAGLNGGGIYASGAAIRLNDTIGVFNNSAANGGGLYLDGTATLTVNGTGAGVAMFDNTAATSGGAIYSNSTAATAIKASNLNIGTAGNPNVATAGNGGGVYNAQNSAFTLSSTTIAYNTATAGSGGGIYNLNGRFTLLRSTIGSAYPSNSAASGGGAYNDGASARIDLVESTLRGNQATGDGGGLYNSNGATFSGVIAENQSTTGNGGGAYNNGAGSTISADIFSNSAAQNGGGVYNALGTVNGWYVSDNAAMNGNGGGVYNSGVFSLNGQSMQRNRALTPTALGGGVYNTGAGTVSFTNATIEGNLAGGNGGAIYSDTAAVTLLHVTMFQNLSIAGTRGLHVVAGTATVNNSLLLNGGLDCGGSSPVATGAYNITSQGVPAECFNPAGTNTDIATLGVAIGAILEPTAEESMKDDYDIDFTFALINTLATGGAVPVPNPAIDFVTNPANCTLNVDQRGAPRPLDGNRDNGLAPGTPVGLCDAGAYEFGAVVLENISIDWWNIVEGDTGSYLIKAPDIDTQPGTTITVTISTNPQCEITAVSSGSITDPHTATAILTYNAQFGNDPASPVTVDLLFTNDPYVEDPLHYCDVTHSATVSGDAYYNNLAVSDLHIGILENDFPGVTVSPLTIGPMTEGAAGVSYSVVLDRSPVPADHYSAGSPAESITITPAFNSTQVGLNPAALTFNSANWNVPQIITVTALADNVNEGDVHASVIMHGLSSSAANSPWLGTPVESVTAQINDIPTVPGAPITAGTGTTVSAGGAATGSPVLLNISNSTRSVRVGDTLVWFFEITSVISQPTAELSFTASFPDGLSIITAGTTQGTISTNAQLVTANIGVIQPGQTVRISVTTTVNQQAAAITHGKLARLALQGAGLCVSATVSGAMPGLPVSATGCATLLPINLPDTGGQPVEPLAWQWLALGGCLALVGGLFLTRPRHGFGR